MIGNHRRRVARLETAIRPAEREAARCRDIERAWLKTLSDDELELMAGVAEHLEAGGSIDAVPVATRERVATIMSTWETFAGD